MCDTVYRFDPRDSLVKMERMAKLKPNSPAYKIFSETIADPNEIWFLFDTRLHVCHTIRESSPDMFMVFLKMRFSPYIFRQKWEIRQLNDYTLDLICTTGEELGKPPFDKHPHMRITRGLDRIKEIIQEKQPATKVTVSVGDFPRYCGPNLGVSGALKAASLNELAVEYDTRDKKLCTCHKTPSDAIENMLRRYSLASEYVNIDLKTTRKINDRKPRPSLRKKPGLSVKKTTSKKKLSSKKKSDISTKKVRLIQYNEIRR